MSKRKRERMKEKERRHQRKGAPQLTVIEGAQAGTAAAVKAGSGGVPAPEASSPQERPTAPASPASAQQA
ncbi:hypothetical protein, partial [Paenibacillus validus]|uniref:hypothetical protein n=1 Tax=Paenibacillus validus TaxID=44253 RepID=UPI002E21F4C5|nr:hypothetical protein [Paenibacillus validus]